MNRLQADLLLLITALIWGTAFVAQKQALAHMGPLTFVGVRFLCAAVLLAPLALFEARRSTEALGSADFRRAAIIGIVLCLGCWMQQFALQTTTAGNAGFLTAVYIVIVPVVAWIFTRHPPRAMVVVAALVSIAGAWLLAGGGTPASWSRGDLIVLLSDIVWAVHINLVGHFSRAGSRPLFLAFLQSALTGAVTLPFAFALEPIAWQGVVDGLGPILYAGIVSSGIAFTLQVIAQRHTPAAEAALIMSLECVFAAIAGAWLLDERLQTIQQLGAALVLVGVVLVEAGPLWRRAVALRAGSSPGGATAN